VDDTLLEFLEKLARFGEDNDARETGRPRRISTSRGTRGACSGSSSAPLARHGSWRSACAAMQGYGFCVNVSRGWGASLD
jgi:hypothetical protein